MHTDFGVGGKKLQAASLPISICEGSLGRWAPRGNGNMLGQPEYNIPA